jgi:hypothetical protein
MQKRIAGADYPTDGQLKQALRTLVAAIPEETQGEATSAAAELLYDFIDYNAQPDEDDDEDAGDGMPAAYPAMAYVRDADGELTDAFLVQDEAGWRQLAADQPDGYRLATE